MSRAPVFTVGHSTHPLDRLVELLRGHGVQVLADVRRYPRSRRHPQFDDDALALELPLRGLTYEPFTELGGRRRPRPDSPNGGWEVVQFQGYADHMESAEFAAGLARLEEIARERTTAVMCAEAPWWRCHRRLLADALLVRGWDVRHVLPGGRAEPHALTEFAVADGERLRYPARQLRLDA